MTTNVLDLRHGIATSDSRWSITWDDAFIYVDNTGFDKIFTVNGYLFVFAGTANLIQIWKNHLADPEATGTPPTEANGMSIAVTVTELATGYVLFEHRQAAIYEEVRFAGSGASHAETCWFMNYCAKRAVETASNYDPYTGGEIKFHEFSGSHNIDLSTTIGSIPAALKHKGMIMYRNRKDVAVPISEAAKTDPRVDQLVDDLACGKQSMCAPFPSMHKPMSSADKRLLEKAIFKVKQAR